MESFPYLDGSGADGCAIVECKFNVFVRLRVDVRVDVRDRVLLA